jgi:hypothetical protein
MKTWLLAIVLFACTAQAAPRFLPHILPDAPSSAYQGKYIVGNSAAFGADQDVESAIKLGERNMAWLTHMNTYRAEGHKIQLTRPGDLKGIPIDAPKKYSPETISLDYQTTYAEMPAPMAQILYSTQAFTNDTPIAETDYVTWAKKVDKNYQTAVRWKLMKPYLSYLTMRRAEDLRGYYFLAMKTDNIEAKLRSAHTLSTEEQAQIKDWLTQMCQNRDGLSADCANKAAASIQSQAAYEFYLGYLNNSAELWNSYFSLENPRPEITWSSSSPNVMNIPFKDPSNANILEFLKFNIEDEFKWDLWNLKLNFQAQADIHVEFEAGVTPHVNGAGGDTITMDANAPLTEWDVQWTIRHEFGHVLGFVDCYEEFYDPTDKAIITYQLDIEHLMCARSGRMQKSLYDTLKQFYYR